MPASEGDTLPDDELGAAPVLLAVHAAVALVEEAGEAVEAAGRLVHKAAEEDVAEPQEQAVGVPEPGLHHRALRLCGADEADVMKAGDAYMT